MLPRKPAAAFAVALMTVGVSGARLAWAAPGDLDPSFGDGGRVTTDFQGSDHARGAALQADGKIVVVGDTTSFYGGTTDFGLARYATNGALDPSFSGDGRQTTDFGSREGAAAAAIGSDGRIVVAGFTDGGAGGDFSVARFRADGALDLSFSGDGRQTTDAGGWDRGHDLALQPDGKIVVAGRAGDDFALVRYTANGGLDASWSGDGVATWDLGGWDSAEAVAVQPDGRIVVAGLSDLPPQDDGSDPTGDFALARFDVDGTPDVSFGAGGIALTDFGDTYDVAEDVALDGEGRLVVAGTSTEGPLDDFGTYVPNDFTLARYLADGTLDPTFDGDGRRTTNFGGDEFGSAVALQPDGRIVTVGRADGAFALARHDAHGGLDTGFANDGMQITDFGGGDEALDVLLQGDGRIVAVGITTVAGHTGDFALARYVGADASEQPPPDADVTPPPEPLASPPAGVYRRPQSVSLSSEEGAAIHYTTDGTEPTPASTRFDLASPIRVATTLTVKAIAIDPAGNRSEVAEHPYTIVKKCRRRCPTRARAPRTSR